MWTVQLTVNGTAYRCRWWEVTHSNVNIHQAVTQCKHASLWNYHTLPPQTMLVCLDKTWGLSSMMELLQQGGWNQPGSSIWPSGQHCHTISRRSEVTASISTTCNCYNANIFTLPNKHHRLLISAFDEICMLPFTTPQYNEFHTCTFRFRQFTKSMFNIKLL